MQPRLHARLAFALLLVPSLVVAAPKERARPPALKAGDECVTTKPVVGSADARGRGAKQRLAAGTSVKVVTVDDAAALIEVNGARVHVPAKALARICRPAGAPPLPAETPEPPAAEEPTEPALEPAPATVAPPPPAVVTPSPVAPAPLERPAEPTPEPPGRDLRTRVRFLAERLNAGYARAEPGTPVHRIAVLDFDTVGTEATSQRLGTVVAETLLTDLATSPGVIVVERAKLKQVVGELQLHKTGDIDPRTATSIGKFVGAGSMIVGSVAEAGAEYLVSARQVSVETASVIQAESVSVDRGELVALSKDLVETKSRLGAALRSALIPGWGQIYTGDTVVGSVLMGGAALVAGSAAFSGTMYTLKSNDYHKNTAASVGARDTANRYAVATNVALGAYGVLWLANIVHAYATGRDVVDVRSPPAAGVSF